MEVLDTTIANVAVPVIAGDLGARLPGYLGHYIICCGECDFSTANRILWQNGFSEVKLFIASVVDLFCCRGLCGIAPNLQALVIFRVLQGFVAGPLIPLSQSLLMASYPPENGHWLWHCGGNDRCRRACFRSSFSAVGFRIIGIRVGFSSTSLSVLFLHLLRGQQLRDRETEVVKTPIDYIGLVLMVVGVGALQMMLDRGKELDWFASGRLLC